MKNIKLVIFILFANCLKAQNLYPIWNSVLDGDTFCSNEFGNLCGYKDSSNKLIIPMDFCRCNGFLKGFAIVEIDEKKGVINKNGKLVIPIEYTTIDHIFYDDTFFTAKKKFDDDSIFVFNKNGKQVFNGQFYSIRFYKNINRIITYPENYNNMKRKKVFQINCYDYNFNLIFTIESKNILYSNFLFFSKKNTVCDYKNSFMNVSESRNLNGEISYHNTIYNLLGQIAYDSTLLSKVDDKLIFQKYGEQLSVSVLDTNLNTLIPFSKGYTSLIYYGVDNDDTRFQDYYTYKKDTDLLGLLDKNLNELTNNIFSKITKRKNDIVCAYENKITAKVDVFDRNLKYVNSITADKIIEDNPNLLESTMPLSDAQKKQLQFKNGPVVMDYGSGGVGLLDSNCKMIVELIYDEIKIAGKCYIAKKEYVKQKQAFGKEKYGILNQKGELIVQLKYDKIEYFKYPKNYFIMMKKNQRIPDVYVPSE